MVGVSQAEPLTVAVLRAFARSPWGQLHYRIARPAASPAGIPLLCLHMSPSSGRVFAPLLGELGRDRVAVAPDTPGFGESDPPPAPIEIADFAAANFGLLDELGLAGPVDVLGYHTGSLTAAEMARQRPARVRRLVLVSAPVFTARELAEFRAAYAERPPAEDGSHLVEHWRAIRRWADAGQSLDLAMVHFAEHLRGGPTAWWGHRAAFNYELGPVLGELPQPILVLNPEDDLHTHTLRAAPLLRHGRIHELPGWSHGFIELRAAAVAALLRQFLDAG
jgi:pimeloyl-ACP methyl ester carboxylesterase